MASTLADIARELGVSKMTVSRAINNHPEISAETRERILVVARRLNYRPNHHARALATRRSYLFGVVVPDLMHSYFAELLRSIESVARPAGFQIVICNTEEDPIRELDEVAALLDRTDGLIIASSLRPEESKAYRKLIREGARIVLIDRELENIKCPLVKTDNVKVGDLATEHLIRRGHTRIGHLRGNLVKVGTDRFEGYKSALRKNRIPFDGRLVRECGFQEPDGYAAMKKWLSEGDLPSAIFAANDPAAIGALLALEEAGISGGEEIAVVGGGNVHYGDMLRIPLTTVSWSRSEMGQAAARMLLDLIASDGHGHKAPVFTVEPDLIVRRSSGL
jgi:LacI family transcriptional regulator